jgi:hypothetical protein
MSILSRPITGNGTAAFLIAEMLLFHCPQKILNVECFRIVFAFAALKAVSVECRLVEDLSKLSVRSYAKLIVSYCVTLQLSFRGASGKSVTFGHF